MSRQRLRAIAIALIVAIAFYIAPSQAAKLQREKRLLGTLPQTELHGIPK